MSPLDPIMLYPTGRVFFGHIPGNELPGYDLLGPYGTKNRRNTVRNIEPTQPLEDEDSDATELAEVLPDAASRSFRRRGEVGRTKSGALVKSCGADTDGGRAALHTKIRLHYTNQSTKLVEHET